MKPLKPFFVCCLSSIWFNLIFFFFIIIDRLWNRKNKHHNRCPQPTNKEKKRLFCCCFCSLQNVIWVARWFFFLWCHDASDDVRIRHLGIPCYHKVNTLTIDDTAAYETKLRNQFHQKFLFILLQISNVLYFISLILLYFLLNECMNE